MEGGDASTAEPSVARVVRHGADDVLLSINSYGRGRASNIPKPPRTAVLPLWNGSQAKPIRGSKFLVVGLWVQKLFLKTEVGLTEEHDGSAGVGAGWQGSGVVGDGRIAIRPYFSVGIVANS